MMYSRFFLILIYISFVSFSSLAQRNKYDNGQGIINLEFNVKDTSAKSVIKKVTDSLVNKGFLSLTETRIQNDSIEHITIEKGNQFKWALIRYDEKKIPGGDRLLSEIAKMKGNSISLNEYNNIMEKILDICEETGYPFASVFLDSIDFLTNDSVTAKLAVNLNKRFWIDTIKIVSKFELSQKYLQNFLDIKKGDVFKRSKVNSIPQMIENIPFAKLKDPPGVIFFGNQVSINLDLIPQQVNRFDFLLGFQRGDISDQKKYKLTGDVMAEMINKIGRGERLFFNYKNLAKGKQELNIQANYPYVLDMPFGVDTKLEIFLNEKEYRDVSINLGLLYLLKMNNSINFYWNKKSSRLLGVDTVKILSSSKLPEQIDVVTDNFGAGLYYSQLDYNFNPTKGFVFKVDASAGFRKIIPNREITAIEGFSSAYDSLKQKTYMLNLLAGIDYFFRFTRNIVLKTGNSTGVKLTQNALYRNELFRLGGLKLLRGFEENEVLSDFYSIASVEIRLLISKNSYFYFFSDYAILRNPFNEKQKWDRPYGVGGGITFETKAGLLQLVAATGSQYGNPLNLRNPNVHIGYTSLFK